MARIKFIRPFKLIKLFMPKNLFGRLLLILIFPLFLATTSSIFLFLDQQLDSVTQRLADDVTGEVRGLIDLYESKNLNFEELKNFAANNFQISVQSASEKELRKKSSTSSLARRFGIGFLDDSLKMGLPYPFVSSITRDNIHIDIKLPHEILQLEMSSKRILSKKTPVYLMWALGLPILFFLISALFIRSQVRPVHLLARSAERFGKGLRGSEIKPSGATEVKQAIKAFNRMRERIIRQIQQRTEMLAGISHDLKTPLTRMELQLAMLEESDDVIALRKDVQDMSQMVDSYLAFAKGEQNTQLVMTNLYDLFQGVSEPFGDKIQLPKRSSIRRQVKVQSLKRCFHNLLSNADKYAKTIKVDFQKVEDEFKISIDDDGPGIPEDKYEDVFKPFYRLDNARNLDIAGTGLGLSIAQDIIHQHGGTITLGPSSLGGLRVNIVLPS